MPVRKANPFSKHLYEEVAVDDLYADGFWITSRGRPIFIGGPSKKVRPKKKRKDVGKWKKRRTKKGKVKMGKDGKPQMFFWTPKSYDKAAEKYKFAITASLAKNAKRIERVLGQEIERKKVDKKTAVATIALLMLETGMRVGGGRGAGKPGQTVKRDKEGNVVETIDTFGATTVKKSEVNIKGDKVTLEYIGKKGVHRKVEVTNRILATSIKKNFLGGRNKAPKSDELLFNTLEGKDSSPVSRNDVQNRMKKFDSDYKPKDLRTLKANEVASDAAISLMNRPVAIPDTDDGKEKLAKKITREIADKTSAILGNDWDVARDDYINPKLIEAVFERVGL